jgi:hypothetical protein
MKPKLYVETTIVGHLTGKISRDVITAAHQRTTRQWWKNRRHAFDLYCSEVVVDEAGTGDKEKASERLGKRIVAAIHGAGLQKGRFSLSHYLHP